MLTAKMLVPWEVNRHLDIDFWTFSKVAFMGKENLQYILDYWLSYNWVVHPFGPKMLEYRAILVILFIFLETAKSKPILPYLRTPDHFKKGSKVIRLVHKGCHYGPAEFEVLDVRKGFCDHEFCGMQFYDVYLGKDSQDYDKYNHEDHTHENLFLPEEWKYLKAHPIYARFWMRSCRDNYERRVLADALNLNVS